MATKYPIILVHGVALKEKRYFRAFGKIQSELSRRGYEVYIADTDAFGTTETNSRQLKAYVERMLDKTGAEKVNLIGHSKGGLDSKEMIMKLGMEDRVASLTTLCTPHGGSVIASRIWNWPKPVKSICAWALDTFYKHVLGDENPDSMSVCQELRPIDEATETIGFTEGIYCQSYSSTLKRGSDCFLMALPMKIYKRHTGLDNDGMVSAESSKFGEYRGDCLDESISHLQIIDFMAKPESRSDIYDFYESICRELAERGL